MSLPGRSSSAVNGRPAARFVPRVAKYPALTTALNDRRVLSPSAMPASVTVCAITSENTSRLSRIRSNSAYEKER
jgi:hypothetical protein